MRGTGSRYLPILRGTGSRYLPLVAFLLLLAAPPWLTTATIGLAFGIGILRIGRRVSGGLDQRPPGPQDGITLGRDPSGRVVTVAERDLSAHVLILGASGSGKTTTLLTILDQQLQRGRPVVAIDMKGSRAFAGQLAAAAVAAGMPFRLWTPEGPSTWNPLRHGNPTELKDKLIGTEQFSEPHYRRAAERYLQNVFQVLEHAHPGRAPTLAQVVALMDPRRLPRALREVPRPLADRIQDYLCGLTPDQRSAIRGLQTRLAIMTESDAGRFLGAGGFNPEEGRPGLAAGAEIDLEAALDGREVVLFSLNSSRYGQFAAQLGTLAVQDLICASGGRLERDGQGQGLQQATVAIDEFSGIGGSQVVALFARGREAGVSAIVATQELADLDRAGRGVRDQILGNTAVKLVLRQDVPQSANLVAQMAGTEKVWEETRRFGGSVFRGFPVGGTRREAEQFIVHPNDIKSLGMGDAVLISKARGERARLVKVEPTGRSSAARARRAARADAAERAPGDRGGPELG